MKTLDTPKAMKTKTPRKKYVLVLRTCNADLTSYCGFKWPKKGKIEAPDWNPNPECGRGLHGLLWGEGDGSLLNWHTNAKWLVVRVEEASIVDLCGKIKFPRGSVVYCGDRRGARNYIYTHGGESRAVVGGTATAGDYGTATAGNYGTATAGYKGAATAGHYGIAAAGDGGVATAGNSGRASAGHGGTATAGDGGRATAENYGTASAGIHGTAAAGHYGIATAGNYGIAAAGVCGAAVAGDKGSATAGNGGRATAGDCGAISILHYDGVDFIRRCAATSLDPKPGELKANVPYRLNKMGEFEEVKK